MSKQSESFLWYFFRIQNYNTKKLGNSLFFILSRPNFLKYKTVAWCFRWGNETGCLGRIWEVRMPWSNVLSVSAFCTNIKLLAVFRLSRNRQKEKIVYNEVARLLVVRKLNFVAWDLARGNQAELFRDIWVWTTRSVSVTGFFFNFCHSGSQCSEGISGDYAPSQVGNRCLIARNRREVFSVDNLGVWTTRWVNLESSIAVFDLWRIQPKEQTRGLSIFLFI